MEAQKKNKPPGRLKKFIKRLLLFFFVMLICLGIFITLIETLFEYDPPQIANINQKISDLGEIESFETHKQLGNSWSKEEEGLTFLYTKGDYFATGYSSGKLVGHIAPKLEDALLERVHEIVGSSSVVWLLRKSGYCLYADLQNYFPQPILEEVYGYSLAVPDTHPELGSSYFRALNYQAAHDTGHRVMENVLQLQGCTSFAAWGNATDNGNLLIGRNFDFEIGDIFDRFKMVHIVVPDEGIPFISVAWPGMSGVVSGVNQHRLAVTINAGKSDHVKWKATPVTIVVRQILQFAQTVEEAISILENSETYVSESFLIADGKNNSVVIVEKSPEKTFVRKPEFFANAITCANHFLTPEFVSHENHQIFVREGSSPKRLERIRELVEENMENINFLTVAKILRDSKIKGNVDIGLSHLHTINPSICSHSVIIDLTASILWISKGPNQAAEYLPISIEKIFTKEATSQLVLDEYIIPEDKVISPDKINDILAWRKSINEWQQKKYTEKEFATLVKNLQNLNEKHFLTMVAVGDLCFQQQKYEEAKEWWQQALNNHPYGEWVTEIEKRIQGDR